MKRKTFIKTSSLAIAGGIIAPQLSCKQDKKVVAAKVAPPSRKNWAGNYTYKAENLHEPTTTSEVQALVKKLDKQKALGSTHCFNNIADSPKNQISTKKLNQIVDLDKESKTITVQSGMRYGDFAEQLHREGFALHNLASLPHITAAGACATATHGSGVENGNLATAVVSVELITPQGEKVTIDRRHPDFNAVVVGLGAFGIITEITLQLEGAYNVRQDVFLDLPLDSLVENFDTIMSAGYSVSLFTNWMDKNVSEVWVKRRTDTDITDLGDDFYGAKAANENIHPIVSLSAVNCTEQMGVEGPWYDRLPHFKMGFTPSAGEELQSEFFVPYDQAVEAILEIEKMRELINPELMITEIRTIAADEFFMSPCYQQKSVAIHFTWKQHTSEVMAIIPQIEAALEPFNVRPHWGKLFTLNAQEFQQRYPRFQEFVTLAKRYDPEGKYRNSFLNSAIYG